MPEQKMIDHLFRHQYGKMVSILIRIFGLQHLETIEDAVQDTFINAMKAWQSNVPENPEAWLTKSAKNRTLDLFRKLSAEDARIANIEAGVTTIAINELFLEHEVEDSVLRMIFTACNPVLNSKDQIAFALRTISGFSGKEIASALLLREETVKKRLVRARKMIQEKHIAFEIPGELNLAPRLDRVLKVIYLIFNEGFHSSRKDMLIREDLCGEAMRLVKVLLNNQYTATPASRALFALFCFQAARLRSKTNDQKEIISLRDQDRSEWYMPLIALGHRTMNKAVDTETFSQYHYEAAIAAEHSQASSYHETNWDKILVWYERLNELEQSPMNLLNMAVVQLQRKDLKAVKSLLEKIQPNLLEQRAYLYYGTFAEYAYQIGNREESLIYIDKAIKLVKNEAELNYLGRQKIKYQAG
ncbi:sigma-70 family RNA polymerase sigma factor [Fulvivirgaceae bacterium BMA10]|uniref:Sigma-70 family RNA polymerase sigma factor n=1 Tax=Splendidivirga corallicola TaxID=3051826 RepID=A0ABT8KVR6_9BACT|nr:sigma-70 family RNA polymerase sigma factor [Fulvivirgaceae bacterium BMA10]